MATTATDALVIVFTALAAEEQDDVFERLHQARLRRDASEESLMGRCIRSMQRVAEHVGHVPSVDEYKSGSQVLRAADEDVETFARLYKHLMRILLWVMGVLTAVLAIDRERQRCWCSLWQACSGGANGSLGASARS